MWAVVSASFAGLEGGGNDYVTMQLDIGDGLVPLLNYNAEQCAWWRQHDPCYLAGNYTKEQSDHAAAVGCGNQ